MNPVRCGVIGYGGAFDMGKAHVEMLEATEGLKVTALCDAAPERLAAARADFPHLDLFADCTQMLQAGGVDLVVVVTPHHTHAELAIQCLEAGRHVIVEKPMCLTVAEGRRMVEAAERAGVLLSVFHNRRWDGSHTALRDILRSGALGEVFQMEAFSGGYGHPGHWWRSDKKISGGCLHDWGAHFIDWMLDLHPGPVADVTGFLQKRRWRDVTNEDHALMTLRFVDGVVAQFEQSSLAAAGKPRWRILGTLGAAVWEDESDEAWRVTSHRDGGQPVETRVPIPPRDWRAYYRNIAEHLLEGAELVVKPDQCLRVIAMLEAAEESARLGRSVPPAIP